MLEFVVLAIFYLNFLPYIIFYILLVITFVLFPLIYTYVLILLFRCNDNVVYALFDKVLLVNGKEHDIVKIIEYPKTYGFIYSFIHKEGKTNIICIDRIKAIKYLPSKKIKTNYIICLIEIIGTITALSGIVLLCTYIIK